MKYIIRFFLLVCGFFAVSQSTDYPLNQRAYEIIDELDVKGEKSFFSTVKPISRRKTANALNDFEFESNAADRANFEYLKLESREYLDSVKASKKPLWNKFYKYPSDLISYSGESFNLHLNPVLLFGGGQESFQDETLFQNYRGVELRGTIDEKVSFYTLINENQARYPGYVKNFTDSTLAIPYEGFWKQYETTGVDFLRTQGYIDFNVSKHIGAQVGYGKHFVGDGIRSMILSDFGNNYPYLRVTADVWKIQYTNIFAQLVAQTAGGEFGLLGVEEFPQKFLSFHRLGIDLTDNFNIGLFESVIFGRADSLGGSNIKAEYLNPVIFYLALEQQAGSSDNVIIGLDFKWNLWRTASLYGQLVIDEMVVSELLDRTGWWGSKQAFQLGAKYFDVLGIDNFNMQAEYNAARPYTYAHDDYFTSYTHYNTPLAHPLGANFKELLFKASYQPFSKWKVTGTFLAAQYGDDLDSASYGRNIQRSYNDRPVNDYRGISIGNGNTTDLLMFQGVLSYFWKHNTTLDITATYRSEKAQVIPAENSTTILGLTLRCNFPGRSYLF
ncbi:MAG: hypothetical protein RIA69_00550 [Cyclobacteriaceae bacterium]